MSVVAQVKTVVKVLPKANRHRTTFFRVLARRPQLLMANGVHELAVLLSAKADARLKQLAELKVAAIVGCEYCLDIGSALAQYQEITEAQLRDLSAHRDSPAFDDRERLVLDVAEALTRVPASLDDDLRRRFEAGFDAAERVEILSLIAWENHRARLNQGLGILPSGFSDGAFCARPELV